MAGDLPDWTTQLASGAVLLGQILNESDGAKGGSLTLNPVPAGVTGISVLVNGTAAATYTVTSVTAQGQTTGQQYIIGAAVQSLALVGAAEYVGTTPGAAEAIVVAIGLLNGAPAGELLGLVVGWLGNTLVHPQNDPDQPLFTQGPTASGGQGGHATDAIVTGPYAYDWQGGVGGSPATDIDVVVAGLRALLQNPTAPSTFDQLVGGVYGPSGKSVQTRREAPQTIGGITPGILAVGAAQELITGVAGQSVRLRRMQLSSSVATELTLRSGSGTGPILWSCFQGFAGLSPEIDFEGWALPAGAGLYLSNNGPSNTAISGRLSVDQY